jgi:hypothetical protein
MGAIVPGRTTIPMSERELVKLPDAEQSEIAKRYARSNRAAQWREFDKDTAGIRNASQAGSGSYL